MKCHDKTRYLCRALAMEQLIEAVDLERECKYQICDFTASREALKYHETRCLVRPVLCPEFTCKQVLPLVDIMDHLKQKLARNHYELKELKEFSYEISTWFEMEYTMSTIDFEMRGIWQCFDILKYKGKEFLPSFTKKDGVYYVWIYLLADPEEARKYSATIHLGEGSQSGLIHKGEVFSIDMDKNDILNAKSGVLSFAQTGKLFSDAITFRTQFFHN